MMQGAIGASDLPRDSTEDPISLTSMEDLVVLVVLVAVALSLFVFETRSGRPETRTPSRAGRVRINSRIFHTILIHCPC